MGVLPSILHRRTEVRGLLHSRRIHHGPLHRGLAMATDAIGSRTAAECRVLGSSPIGADAAEAAGRSAAMDPGDRPRDRGDRHDDSPRRRTHRLVPGHNA
jgi:hypothetical protein